MVLFRHHYGKALFIISCWEITRSTKPFGHEMTLIPRESSRLTAVVSFTKYLAQIFWARDVFVFLITNFSCPFAFTVGQENLIFHMHALCSSLTQVLFFPCLSFDFLTMIDAAKYAYIFAAPQPTTTCSEHPHCIYYKTTWIVSPN